MMQGGTWLFSGCGYCLYNPTKDQKEEGQFLTASAIWGQDQMQYLIANEYTEGDEYKSLNPVEKIPEREIS